MSSNLSKAGMAAETGVRETQSVAALARGISILDQFTRHCELGGAELARLTGLAQPTVWRLCYTLKSLGVLQDSANGRMRLGTGALSLGFEALSGLALPEAARPFMQAIADEFGAAVTLALRQGMAAIYVQRCQSERLEFSGLRVGTSTPLQSSPVGWALIAELDVAERAALIDQLVASSALAPGARRGLERALQGHDGLGYVESHGLLHPNLVAVSAPLARSGYASGWALSCGGHDASFGGESLMRAGARLRELADVLSLFVPEP